MISPIKYLPKAQVLLGLRNYPSNKTKNIFGCRFIFIFLFTKTFVCQFHLQRACSVWASIIGFCVFTFTIKFSFSVATPKVIFKEITLATRQKYIFSCRFTLIFLFTKTFVCQFHLQPILSQKKIILFCPRENMKKLPSKVSHNRLKLCL